MRRPSRGAWPGPEFAALYVLGSPDGQYLSPNVLTRDWTTFAKMYDIVGNQGERLTLHGLRHTYATVAIEAGADVKSVSDNLGHANTTITMDTYASATAEGKRRTSNLVDNVLNPGNGDVTMLDRAEGE